MAKRSLILFTLLAGILFLNSCKNKAEESKEHLDKGNEFVFKDDFTNAKKEYELAVKIDSGNWKACYALAGVYEMEGDFAISLFFFNKTLELNPNFSLGYFNRSNLEDMIGDKKSSARDLSKAIELKKDFYIALLTRGQKQASVGKLKDAVNDFNAAINVRSDFYLAFSMRGTCKLRSGDADGALKDFEAEIALKPDHPMSYVNRAVAYAQKKDYRPAIADINIALQMDPTWSQGYIYRGMYEYYLGSKDSACGDFRMAYKLKNPDAENYSKEYCK